jgi:micrococcal nuclease
MTDVLRYIALPTGAGLMHARSLIAAVAIVVALMGGVVLAAPAQAYPSMPQGVQGPFTVTKVVDGDTIWVNNNGKRQKIRMIGMDTPETVDPRKPVQCFGLEASAQAKTILGGQSVYLETDPSQDTVDKYGRTLAYVWTTSGRLFNLDMIADGYAHEYTYYVPYRYQQEFKAAQSDARTQERGLWSPKACAA